MTKHQNTLENDLRIVLQLLAKHLPENEGEALATGADSIKGEMMRLPISAAYSNIKLLLDEFFPENQGCTCCAIKESCEQEGG